MTPFQQITNNKTLTSNSGDVIVRSYIRKKPKATSGSRAGSTSKNPSSGTRRGPSMDVASFKTIVNIQKENMKIAKDLKKENPDPIQASHKKQWSSFMKTAAKASRKTKRKLHAARRAVKLAEEERSRKLWITLFRKIELYQGRATEAEKKLYKNWPRPLPDSFCEEAQRLYKEWQDDLMR